MKPDNGFIPDEDIEYENEQQEHEKAAAELEKQHKAELEKKLREEKEQRQRQLERDRVELMKLRQGLVSEEEASLKPEAETYVKPKGKKAVENFFYHYKWHVIAIAFAVVFITLFTVDMLTKVDPDIKIIYLPKNELNNHLTELEDYFEGFAEDINGDGKIYVQIISVPVGTENYDAMSDVANQTKLAGEVQAGITMLFISDEKSDAAFSPEGLYMTESRLEEVFTIRSGMSETGFMLSPDVLAEKLSLGGEAELPEDMYIAIREPVKLPGVSEKSFMENWDASKDFLEKLLEDLYS